MGRTRGYRGPIRTFPDHMREEEVGGGGVGKPRVTMETRDLVCGSFVWEPDMDVHGMADSSHLLYSLGWLWDWFIVMFSLWGMIGKL